MATQKKVRRGDKDVIIAAGGLIWNGIAGVKKLAIIHRKKYDDWSLPKGKRKPRETLRQTAIREVKEETGFEVTLKDVAGVVEYDVKGIPKMVLFWNMVFKGGDFNPGKEVDGLKWVSAEQAVAQITYPEERRLVKMLDKQSSFLRRLAGEIRRVFILARYARIRGTLESYRQELEAKVSCLRGLSEAQSCHLGKALMIVKEAEGLLEMNQIDEAWKCLFAAQRIEVMSLSQEEIEIRATILRREADKLSSWRKGAVEDLLGTPTQPKPNRKPSHIHDAMVIRDEHYSNVAHKDSLAKTHFLVIGALLFGALVCLVILSNIGFLEFEGSLGEVPQVKPDSVQVDSLQTAPEGGAVAGTTDIEEDACEGKTAELDWKLLLNVALFGLLGSSFSAALKLPSTTSASRIPELVGAIRVTLMRVLVGAVSAVVILILLNSSAARDLFDAIFSQAAVGELSLPVVYFFAFAAGFTERIALKAVEFVAKDKK